MAGDRRVAPRDDAAEAIESYIAINNLQPGDRLPADRELAQLCQVSRSTVRTAIRHLTDAGRLRVRQGSGTFVAAPKLVRNLQTMELMSLVCQRQGSTLSTSVLSSSVIPANKQIGRVLKLTLGHPVFFLYRMRSADHQPILTEMSYIDYERCPGIELIDFTRCSLYDIMRNQFDLDVCRGIETIGVTYPTDSEAELLGVGLHTAMFYLSGTADTHDIVPVEYFKSVVRADMIKFSSQLRLKEDIPS